MRPATVPYAGRMTDIPRTPRGRQEKLGGWGVLVLFSVPSLLITVFRGLGLSAWESIGGAVLVVALGAHLVSRPVRAARRRRRAADLELGVIDCAIRFPGSRPGSLSDVWDVGAGQVEGSSLHFQAQLGDQDGTPAGRRKTFSSAVLTDSVPDVPSTQHLGRAQRTWRSIYLRTDGGLLQVAAPQEGCALLERAFAPARRTHDTSGRS